MLKETAAQVYFYEFSKKISEFPYCRTPAKGSLYITAINEQVTEDVTMV